MVGALLAVAPVAAADTGGGVVAPSPDSAAAGAGGGASYGVDVVPGGSPADKQDTVRKRHAKRKAHRKLARRRKLAHKQRVSKRGGLAFTKKTKKKRKPKPVVRQPTTPEPLTSDHAFPVQGAFTFGGAGSRFGAGRPGHTHQGQDVAAAEGVPVVAPWAGTVEVVRYQAGGAGYYVVLDGDSEDRDYVFMHLRKGSTLVKAGDHVGKGQQLAQVGNTGSSEGSHLHFEIWIGGGWYTGGHPVDPLPFLRAWAK